MTRLKVEKSRKVISRLRKLGFVHKKSNGGSHQIFLKVRGDKPYLVTVPVHKGRDITTRVMRSIIEQSGLTKEEFYKDS